MAKKDLVLCDTNILIELLKNNPTIVERLNSIGEDRVSISMVTAAELIFGALNKTELSKINKLIGLTSVFPINETISSISLDLLQRYTLSHITPTYLIRSLRPRRFFMKYPCSP